MKKARPSKNLFGFASLPEPQKPDGKATLTPKLRFPEFRDAEGWENKLIAPYLEDCSGRVPPDTKLPIYSSTREGLKRQDVYFDGRVLQNKNEYGVVPPGCLVYRHMSDDGLFKFNINETGGDIAVSKEYPVFRTKGLHPFFLLTKLNEGRDFKQFALSQKAGGTRTRLYFSRLCEWTTLLPSLPEQQRIADCLNSLDELIAAEARKLEALKTHKKGLMQQLFPREGETQPRLRFPEFQNAGEWKETRLGKMGELISGLTYSPDDVREHGLLVLRSSNVQNGKIALLDCVYVDPGIKGANLSLPNDILICVRNGSTALIGKSALIPKGMPLCTHGAFMTIFRSQTPSFVFQLFQTAKYQKQVAGDLGATINSINGSQFLKYKFFVPKPPEQQRIADCLTSLDDLIAAQTQKLSALKAHKKALMQQLFPSAEN
jgi:type I restriction enzyme S subunit